MIVINTERCTEPMIYVCGFAVDYDEKHVLLVRKSHPKWQAGKLNGIGGKVDNGESSQIAMAREFKEETRGRLIGSHLYALSTHEHRAGWQHVVTLGGPDWQCLFFVGYAASADLATCSGIANDVGEPLQMTKLSDLYDLNVIPNIRWLIPFALSSREYAIEQIPLVMTESSPGAIRQASTYRAFEGCR